MKPLRRAEAHQPVIGGMVVEAVQAPPLRVECSEPRRILVGLAPELGRGGAPGDPAEGGEVLGGIGGALPRHRLAQDDVRREQVHVGKGRALVQHLLSLRNWIRRHGILYGI